MPDLGRCLQILALVECSPTLDQRKSQQAGTVAQVWAWEVNICRAGVESTADSGVVSDIGRISDTRTMGRQ